jgi:hypothetical protein
MELNASQSSDSENAEREELISSLRNQIDRLPELDGQLLACCYVSKMTHHKIAEVLGIPRQTVTDKLKKAIEQLRLNLTKAGVAAVVPLLNTDSLFDALTTGYSCPPGMTERLMSRVESIGSVTAKTFSTRSAVIATKSSSGMLLVVASVVAAACVGIASWWMWHSSTKTVSILAEKRPEPLTISASDISKTSSPIETEKPFYARWTFEKGPPSDIKVLQGMWKWESNTKNKQAINVMAVVDKDMAVQFPQALPSGYVLASIKFSVQGEGLFSASTTNLLKKDKFIPKRIWTKTYSTQRLSVFSALIYIHEQYAFSTVNGTPHSVRRFEDDVTGGQLILVLNNVKIEEIELRSIQKEEVPPEFRDPEKCLQNLIKHGWKEDNSENGG